MSRATRLIVVWVLAFALPLQAATAAMLACAAGHVPGGAPSAVQRAADHAHPHGTAPHHGSHAPKPHHHGAGADEAADRDGFDVAAERPQAQHDASSTGEATGSCSVCASCCTGAALPATAIALSAPALSEGAVSTAQDCAPVFITTGPERPPRTLHA